jgi:peptide/nickel transport system substrate-binding protein
MRKKITTKDISLFSLLFLIIVLIILAMYQKDREWNKLSAMERALSDQSRDVSALRSTLSVMQKKLASADLRKSEITNATDKEKENKSGVSKAFKRAYKATQNPDYAQGGWLIGSFGSTLQTITPLVSSDVYAGSVQGYVLESLLTLDPNTLEWQGMLAKSWQISDDGLTITFQLRDDVVFSDGEPFDSKDVVFTFNFIMNEKIKAPRERAYYEKIESVTANGKYEVAFKFKETYFKALNFAGGMAILSKKFYSPYLDDPETFNQSKGLLMGTGPYKLEDPKNWTSQQDGIELVRNTRYWGEVPPSYDRLVWKIIQNESARLTTFRNGDIDIYEDAQPIDFEKLKDDPQLTKISTRFNYVSPGSGYGYIGWNQLRDGKPTRFRDKRVRQAMTWLIDKEKIAKDIYLGYRQPAVSSFGSNGKQHDPALKPRKQDIAKGKALLKAAGFEDRDGDGVIESADGKPFEFELIFFQNNETSKRLVLLLKDMYARAGIKLIPVPSEWPVMLEKLDSKDFEAITLGWGGTIESDMYQIFHSSQAKTNGDNYISYSNPELDKIIEEARATMDEEKRMALWRKAEHIIYDDLPYTFLAQKMELGFINKRIHNLEQTKLGLNAIVGIPVENYIPAELQKHTH